MTYRELFLSGNQEGLSGRKQEELLDKTELTDKIVDKLSIKQGIIDKLSINDMIVDKFKINDDFIDNMTVIIMYLIKNPHSSTETLSTIVDKSVSRTKNYLQALVELQCVIAEGGNRNRTYSFNEAT